MAWCHFRLRSQRTRRVVLCALLGMITSRGRAQGPTPETGNTIFPGGGLVSYSADFVSRKAPAGVASIMPTLLPTLGISQPLILSWGFRRDFELTAMTSIDINHLSLSAPASGVEASGSGLGDSLVLVKYRFLRRDSPRGTTQASLMIGPKLPTGRTNLLDDSGARLPVSLQPGTGSIDLFANFSGTYTGLFHLEKLVADGTLDYLRRSEGTQQTQLGNSLRSRLYFPYRPYESHSVGKEWWIGPELVWDHQGYMRINGLHQSNSGGDAVSVGAATYFSPHPGLELWFGVDFAVAQQWNGSQDAVRRHISVGVSKQFEFHH